MSLHAQLSPETFVQLRAQQPNSRITSIIISILVVLLFCWNQSAVAGVMGSFQTTDKRYIPGESFSGNQTTHWQATAWRGERIHRQIVLWSDDATPQGLTMNIGEISDGNGNSLPETSVQLRTEHFIKSWDDSYADRLDPEIPSLLQPGQPLIFWFSIDVPRDATPGSYSCQIQATVAGNDPIQFSVTVDALEATLPQPGKGKFHLDIWERPTRVADWYGVEQWSEEHFELLRTHYQLLADAGDRTITVSIVNNAIGAPKMITWTKNVDGSWSYDYSIMDDYINFMMELGIDQQITLFSARGWNGYNVDYHDAATGETAQVYAPPGSDEARAVWTPFFDSLAEHFREKGWLNKAYFNLNEIPPDEAEQIITLVNEVAPEFKIMAALNVAHNTWLSDNVDDLSLVYNHTKDSTLPMIEERNSKGLNTTVYTCVSPPIPNNFLHSSPAESAWIGWYAAERGFNGFLRWAFNLWPEEVMTDGTHHANHAPGDAYLIYPEAQSSIRWERIIEGMQDYEKVQLLRTRLKEKKGTVYQDLLQQLNTALDPFVYTTNQLPWGKHVSDAQGVVNQIVRDCPASVPVDGASGVSSGKLEWVPGWSNELGSHTNSVYVGTDITAVTDADTSSPEYQGSTSESGIFYNVQPHTTYYWRVDTVTALETVTGPVRSFTTGAVSISLYHGDFTESAEGNMLGWEATGTGGGDGNGQALWHWNAAGNSGALVNQTTPPISTSSTGLTFTANLSCYNTGRGAEAVLLVEIDNTTWYAWDRDEALTTTVTDYTWEFDATAVNWQEVTLAAGSNVVFGSVPESDLSGDITGFGVLHGPLTGGETLFLGSFEVISQLTATEAYTLTVESGSGSGDYTEGTTVTITADAPLEGYQFANWMATAGTIADTTSATTTFTMPAEAATITANYDAVPPKPQYLVIDLSEGASAVSYPITYQASLPDPITDEYKTTKLVMRRIPAGTFLMGAPEDEDGYWGEVQHEVTLTKDFYTGVFEVTQKQWSLIMGDNPSAHKYGDVHPVEDIKYKMIRGNDLGSGWPESDAVDAGSFLGVLRTRTGPKLDLPTSAQWEYACRAGTTLAYNDQTKNDGAGSDCIKYNRGGVDDNLEPLAWYAGNSIADHHHGVGLKQANAWGLYDMTGNVYEWCLDWYQAYTSDSVVDPVGADSGGVNSIVRIIRGGAHFYDAFECRSAAYRVSNPNNHIPDGATAGGGYVGFRLAYTVHPNYAPQATADPVMLDVTVKGGVDGTLTDHVFDANDDAMTFTKTSGDAWLEIASDGSLSGYPLESHVGTNDFEVEVSDGASISVVNLQVSVTSPEFELYNDFGERADNGPGFVQVSNVSGRNKFTDAGNIETGLISFSRTGGNPMVGLSSDAPLDFSAKNGFKVTYVVSGMKDPIATKFNGLFFGMTDSSSKVWSDGVNNLFGVTLFAENHTNAFDVLSKSSGSTTRCFSTAAPSKSSLADGFTIELTVYANDTWSVVTTNTSADVTQIGRLPAGAYSGLASSVFAQTALQTRGSNQWYDLDLVTVSSVDDPHYYVFVTKGSGEDHYDAGETVTITADAPLSNGTFVEWVGDIQYLDDPNSAIATFTMPEADVSLEATFVYEAQLDSGLLLHWSFDGNGDATTVEDISGNSITGTITGDGVRAEGLFGQAMSFGGNTSSGGGVIHDLVDDVTYNEYSVSLWAKAASLGQGEWCSLFSNDSAGSDFQIDVDGANPGSYRFNSGESLLFGAYNTNDWVHLSIVCDGTVVRLYQNGTLVNTTTGASGQVFGEFLVGANRGHDQIFNGLIDEVRVYNRILNDTEVDLLATPLLGEMYTLTVESGTGSGDYAEDAVVSISSDAPAEGYQFAGWTASAGVIADASAASTTFTMPANEVSITATYSAINSQGKTVTVQTNADRSITLGFEVQAGRSYRLEYSPDLKTWYYWGSAIPVSVTTTQLELTDDGVNSGTHPNQQPRRFYRLVDITDL